MKNTLADGRLLLNASVCYTDWQATDNLAFDATFSFADGTYASSTVDQYGEFFGDRRTFGLTPRWNF